MDFEYDHDKSQYNKHTHGIDFEEAQALWEDDERAELPAKTVGEPRRAVIAAFRGKIWTAVITQRGENIRLISVRRARKKEIEYYEERQKQIH